MKRLTTIFAILVLVAIVSGANAQSKAGAEYFAGKWKVLIKGTPQGDVNLVFVLDKNKDSIAGVVQDTTGVEITKLSNVELQDSTITLYFTAQGYDLNLLLAKKGDDHVAGSLLAMFDAEGDRIKATAETKK
jgi:hypothetical protein